jgi:hypothetical protein
MFRRNRRFGHEKSGEKGKQANSSQRDTQLGIMSCALTEERVLQAEQSVLLGGRHVAELAVAVRCGVVQRFCAPLLEGSGRAIGADGEAGQPNGGVETAAAIGKGFG